MTQEPKTMQEGEVAMAEVSLNNERGRRNNDRGRSRNETARGWEARRCCKVLKSCSWDNSARV